LAFLFGLDASERHLGSRDELLGVFEVLEEVVFGPNDTRVLVGSGVRVAFSGTGLAVDAAPEVGTNTVSTALVGGVALSSTSLEDLFTLLDVTGHFFVLFVVIKKKKLKERRNWIFFFLL
jgi:hypothetical protein